MSALPPSSDGAPPDAFWVGGAFHVEPSLNRVTGPNGVTRLEPKAMQVLVCLTERAGQMVPKGRLLGAAWADTAVTDDVLTRAISELRRLFEDDPRRPRIIETIPKAGYRLIAPVAHRSSPAAATTPSPTPLTKSDGRRDTPAPLPRRSRRHRAAVLAAGGLVFVAWAWWLRSPHNRTHAPVPIVSLSVPPGTRMWFAAKSDQGDVEWNGETVADATIYITIVSSSEARPLPSTATADPGPCAHPMADGPRVFAFGRVHVERCPAGHR